MFTTRFQKWVRRNAQRLATRLVGLGVTPNEVTVAGMLVTFAAAGFVAVGWLLPAGLILAFSGTFDILDGALARASRLTYNYGAFLDSTSDRLSEGAIYIGVAAYFLAVHGPLLRWQVLGCLLALAGSYLVSYVRARAQSLGYKCDVGLFARPERVVAIVAGLILAGLGFEIVLTWIVFALALLTNLTVLQRINEVWRQAREERRIRREELAMEVPRGTRPEG
ncbi:MAG TPA: CDP-alcohol phosphatidyltransferase family protein [Solirubrobacterales bacterium]|nr:CDP-alcohol phosphatidyltransferase family protein [Solirubrobacterales bacterium]